MNLPPVLDVGCGRGKTPGAYGVDHNPDVQPDLVYDLNRYPYPFEDNQFERVVASHIIEHVQSPLDFLKELWRITKPGGIVNVATPHFSCYNSYGDLTHLHHLGWTAFHHLQGQGQFRMARYLINMPTLQRRLGLGIFANAFPRKWEKYLCWMFPAMDLHLYLEVLKPALPPRR